MALLACGDARPRDDEGTRTEGSHEFSMMPGGAERCHLYVHVEECKQDGSGVFPKLSDGKITIYDRGLR